MSKAVVVVTGTARCGVSLVTRMLKAGGMQMPVGVEQPDREDPRVALLPDESEWLAEEGGRVVKLRNPQIFRPPMQLSYSVVMMLRNADDQVIAHMKANDQAKTPEEIRQLVNQVNHQQNRMMQMWETYPNARVLPVSFDNLVRLPSVVATRIAQFIEGVENPEELMLDVRAMRAVIRPSPGPERDETGRQKTNGGEV